MSRPKICLICKLDALHLSYEVATKKFLKDFISNSIKRLEKKITSLTQLRSLNLCNASHREYALELRAKVKAQNKDLLINRINKIEIAIKNLAELDLQIASERIKNPNSILLKKLEILRVNKKNLIGQRRRRLEEMQKFLTSTS